MSRLPEMRGSTSISCAQYVPRSWINSTTVESYQSLSHVLFHKYDIQLSHVHYIKYDIQLNENAYPVVADNPQLPEGHQAS